MTEKKKTSKTKQTFNQVIDQAKESLKILGTLEKETLAKAKTFIKIPTAADRKKLTNDRILSSLKKLGVATHREVEALEQKIHKLETALHAKSHSSSSHSHSKSANAEE